jgi:phosphorylcholine metabolism protein LicD
MVKNSDVVEDFIFKDKIIKAKTRNLFFEDNTLYSYGYHYPLCIKIKDNSGNYVYFLNSNGYSNTTARHKGYVVRSITRNLSFKELIKAKQKGEYNHIFLLSTNDLKNIIDTIKYKLNKTITQSNTNDLVLLELEKNV